MPGLQLRDLRHEAGSRFDEAGVPTTIIAQAATRALPIRSPTSPAPTHPAGSARDRHKVDDRTAKRLATAVPDTSLRRASISSGCR